MIQALALAALCATLPAGPGLPRAGPLEISLHVDRCPALQRDEVARLLALELDTRVVTPAEAGEHAIPVRLACAGPEVDLSVSDPITGKWLERRFTVGPAQASVTSRLVALAISELVITSWMELTLRDGQAAPPSDAAASSAELRAAARDRVLRYAPPPDGQAYVLLVGQVLGPFDGVGAAWGGGLRAGRLLGGTPPSGQPAPLLRLAGDLELGGAWTVVQSPSGAVHLSMVSAALRATARLGRGRVWLELGAGGRFGVARVEGVPMDPTTTRGHTVAGTWAGPNAYLGVGARLGRIALTAGLEAGYVLRPVSGLVDGGSTVAVSGGWLATTLAIGWRG